MFRKKESILTVCAVLQMTGFYNRHVSLTIGDLKGVIISGSDIFPKYSILSKDMTEEEKKKVKSFTLLPCIAWNS